MKSWKREPATILIVDHDPITLTGVAAVLNTCGYECHCARDGEAALKAGRGLPLDLVICDIELNEDDGLELCRELRQLDNMEDVPVMFLTGADSPDIIQRCHEAGGSYYLRKPFDPDVLIELVDKALWMPHLVNNRIGQMHISPGSSKKMIHQ